MSFLPHELNVITHGYADVTTLRHYRVEYLLLRSNRIYACCCCLTLVSKRPSRTNLETQHPFVRLRLSSVRLQPAAVRRSAVAISIDSLCRAIPTYMIDFRKPRSI